ncbi:MAG: hypothetical protein JSU66_13165 [Deltaproteobacteria bacterium]|nr:MAG: hypothetical protein JSU66_13165 [Deltaproteobacteria bacterium]
MQSEGSDHRDGDRRREEREAWREERRREREARRRQRKGRILHTRISEQLAEDIRRVADDLRVPVSNLVRNVLDEAFSAVESVSENVGDLVEDIVEEAERAQTRMRRRRSQRHAGRGSRWHGSEDEAPDRDAMDSDAHEDVEADIQDAEGEAAPRRERPEFPDVVGWQPLLLNREQTCADCGRELGRGTRAFVGLTAAGLSQKTLCRACVNSRE